MKCPFCGFTESKVLDTRTTEDDASIRRRRECVECQKRFTTYEVINEVPLVVIKKNGQREVFDRNKIVTGCLRACDKRTITLKQLEELAEEVERDFLNGLDREIQTESIGEKVMERLFELDQVAYVRFASVYREFTDLERFRNELERLLGARRDAKA